MSCSNKMNVITNEALIYSKAPLIESVLYNPSMKAIGGKIMNEIPNNWATVTNVSVISYLPLLLADEHTDKA